MPWRHEPRDPASITARRSTIKEIPSVKMFLGRMVARGGRRRAARSALAACGGGDDEQLERRARRRLVGPPAALTQGQAAAAVVHPGPVRRLHRRAGQGLLQGRRASTSRSSRAASTSCPQTQLAQGQADYAIAWVPKALQSREQGAGITDVGQVFQRSGHAAGLLQGQEHHHGGRPQGQEGRQLGLRQRVRAVRRHDQGRPRPGQGRHARAAAVRHAGAAQGRHRRRPGDDLQRVRPGARGQEPGHRRALHSPRTSTSINWNDEGTAMLQDAIWADTEKLDSDKAYQDQTVKFLTGHASRAGSTAATTPRSAATSSSRRAPSSATATSCGR